jgi:hypothetical protein
LEPVFAVAALGLGHPLFLLTFWTDAIHLPLLDIVGKDQSAARAFGQIAFSDLGAAAGGRADKDAFAGAAPELSFGYFFTNRALVHNDLFISAVLEY